MLYHIDFSKTGMGLSGGETCMLQLIRHSGLAGWKSVLGTTDNGRETYTRLGFCESSMLTYCVVNSWSCEQMSLIGSYVVRTRRALKVVNSLRPRPRDVLICHCDYFPTTLPFWALRRKHPHCQFIYFAHMPAPALLRGYRGHFTDRWSMPGPRLLFTHLNQWLAKLLTSRQGTIVAVNECFRPLLEKQYPRNRVEVLRHFGGIETGAEDYRNCPKPYDVAWLGRFHAQKGLDELVEVLVRLKALRPGFRCLVIGGGSSESEAAFRLRLEQGGIARNVHLAGTVVGREKYRLLSQARAFAMTSLYESFGIVTLEAMSLGIPVVAFDLPPFDVFGDGICRVPVLDTAAFAGQLAELLTRPAWHAKCEATAIEASARFSWKATWEDFAGILERNGCRSD